MVTPITSLGSTIGSILPVLLIQFNNAGKILPKVDRRLVIGVTITIVSIIQVIYSLK
jgi:hypothetical protein